MQSNSSIFVIIIILNIEKEAIRTPKKNLTYSQNRTQS